MEEKVRNYFIDIIKGAAIFLMLWGHCIQYCVAGTSLDFFENGVFKFIYSFHMPLFMLISGYLFFFSFSKRDLKELLAHRTQAMLWPIVLFTLLRFLVTTVPAKVLKGEIGYIFDGHWLDNLPSLWFLWSVLAASLATAVVCKKVKHLSVQILLLIAAIPVIAIFPNMNQNLFMYPYFVIGFYFAWYKDKLPAVLYKLKYATLFLFPVLLCFYEKKHYIYISGIFPSDSYSAREMVLVNAYRWLMGLVGSVFAITILQKIYRYVTVKIQHPLLSRSLTKLGQKSLQIYALSVPFLSVYLPLVFHKMLSVLKIDNVFTQNMLVYNFIFTPLLSVVYSFALYYLTKLFERMKLSKMLFGK